MSYCIFKTLSSFVQMRKQKNLPRIVTTFVFVGLLAGTILLSVSGLSSEDNDEAGKRVQALKQYGFYLALNNREMGIDFRHTSPELDPKLRHIERQIASIGASVSICDFDNDGWNDIYFTNSSIGSKNALYHNLQNGKFQDVSVQAGLSDVNKKGSGVSMGAVWGDYNNDGFEDLFLYKWGRPELFRNDSGRNFVRVTEESGLPQWVNANSAIWFDFDNDGLLDLFLGGYYSEAFDLSNLSTTKIMPESFKYANNGGRNYLLKNEGMGRFKDVAKDYGLISTKWTLAAGAADITGDGYPELVVANDYGVDEFYINRNGKKFDERGKQTGMSLTPKSGMNVAFGDIDDSGIPGIYITNITEKGVLIQGNSYWKPKNPQTPDIKFINLAQLAGIENAGWSYGAQFGDLNNDGYLDLYVANGFVSGKKGTSYWYDYSKVTGGNSAIIGDARNWPDMEGKSQSGYQQNKVWINNSNGLFEDVSGKVCLNETLDGRAVVMADLWNRGVLDVIVANQNNTPLIYKNELQNNYHWVDFDLRGTESNASAIGAKVMLEWNNLKQTQIVTGGIGFSSQNQHRLHFGTGTNTKINRVVILWPSGQVQEIANPAIDQLHIIREPKLKP